MVGDVIGKRDGSEVYHLYFDVYKCHLAVTRSTFVAENPYFIQTFTREG